MIKTQLINLFFLSETCTSYKSIHSADPTNNADADAGITVMCIVSCVVSSEIILQ